MATGHVMIQYCPVPENLAPYIGAVFYCDFQQAGSDRLHDILFPAWGSLRFQYGSLWHAEMDQGAQTVESRFVVAGPRTRQLGFSMGTGRQWGIRLRPLGWAALTGVPADAYADRIADGDTDETFARFRPLYDLLAADDALPGLQFDRFMAFLEALPKQSVLHAHLVASVEAALADPDVRTAAEMAERAGCKQRTLERACRAIFGFTPKMLVRRHRFLRSLEHYASNPARRWVGAMDQGYHDQAQFVRDFRAFMGMTPREYAALDKPVMDLLMRERLRGNGNSEVMNSVPI
ncbi:AraC family transcriptional regulator [Novosphingobium album (ex Hu et al. 2023)]|uniref:Helix-turn-helix domain-containing protein n=1 Tax=Novosphingobium album (ex Hu et al. 2023) TaxID=2930093 RepID=A0ABT0B6Y6_9SPHN|nr:helix-turn-helix domain-containing protein [Novosphingobium album (ex Hu et al. 2023)]MCJ2180778.1 helix-turn-helix domain-containing protein [Novosphingobium album (ex Hu et al. 2023)]